MSHYSESEINNNESEINNNESKINTFVKTPEWLCNKKCAINPKNKDNKCFQHSATLSMYHKQIGKIWIEYQILNHLSTILIRKILFFHQNNKIINNLI